LSASALSALTLCVKIASNVAVIPIALKSLGREEYGLWIILQSIGTYLVFSDIGLGQTIANSQGVAYAREDYDEVNRLMTTGFGLYWCLIIPIWLLSSVVLLTQPVQAWLLKDSSGVVAHLLKPCLFLFATLTLLRVPVNIFPASLVGLRETSLRQVVECGLALFLLAGTVLTLALGGKLLALILVTNLGLILIPALNYPLILLRHPRVVLARRFWAPGRVSFLLANSSFFLLFGLGLFFQKIAGNILAGKVASLKQVPEMFVLLVLIRVGGWSLADIVSRSLQPYMIMFTVQGRRDRMLFFAKLCTGFTFAFATVYSVLIYQFTEAGLKWWLGPGLFLGYGPLAFLIGSFLIEVLFLSTTNFMLALNRHKGLSAVMGGYAVLSFVLGFLGARWWMPGDPLRGLCAGFFLASILGQALPMPWITNRWLAIGWSRYCADFLLKPAALALFAVFLLAVLGLTKTLSAWRGGFGALVGTASLAALAWFWVFGQHERRWMLNAARTHSPFFRSPKA
jgi:O-antigen/teichoic acid export membrane protein